MDHLINRLHLTDILNKNLWIFSEIVDTLQIFKPKTYGSFRKALTYLQLKLTDLAVLVGEAVGQEVHLVLGPLREGRLECV